MTQEFGSDHARLARLGGTGALLSGAIFLLTLLYTYGYLISLGLTVEMLDDHEQLLPWVARHNGSYLGLWWIYLASQLCLLPVPVALHHRFQHVGSALSLVGAVAGVAAIVVGIVSIAINAATAPVLGPAYVAAEASRRPDLLVLSDLVGSLQLYVRMFSDLLFAIWFTMAGLALLRQPGPWRFLGTVLIGLATVILLVVGGKPLNLLDLEPFLGLLLAVAYLWIGVTLLGDARRSSPGASAGDLVAPASIGRED